MKKAEHNLKFMNNLIQIKTFSQVIKTHILSTSEKVCTNRNMKVQDKVVPISQRQENEKQVTLPMKAIA